MKNFRALTAFLFLAMPLFAQTGSQPMDTVYLMSGNTVAGVVKDSSDDELKILIPKKDGSFKADFIDLDLVFSVKYKNGQESVFYKQDTLFGNYYSEDEVRYFIYGERDARSHFRCPVWNAGAFAAGFAGGWTQSLFMFVPPFAYAGITTFFRVKIKPGTVGRPEYLQRDTYLLGYEKDARKRRIMRSLIWGGIGMAMGYTSSYFYYQNHSTN
ncbi:MAG TPA: hypothetical protein VFU15_02685 [Bacteroidia bacterium]|nr:hypothetical protein [Bacteroidia bacterium]